VHLFSLREKADWDSNLGVLGFR